MGLAYKTVAEYKCDACAKVHREERDIVPHHDELPFGWITVRARAQADEWAHLLCPTHADVYKDFMTKLLNG